jgi:hypothetical protein
MRAILSLSISVPILIFLDDGFKGVVSLITAYHQLLSVEKKHSVTPELIQEIEENVAAADWDYLGQEPPLALAQSKDGIQVAVFRKIFSARSFDLFFTTKEVGKGTGQGLAIARDVRQQAWRYVGGEI